jgi:hypothetical protein
MVRDHFRPAAHPCDVVIPVLPPREALARSDQPLEPEREVDGHSARCDTCSRARNGACGNAYISTYSSAVHSALGRRPWPDEPAGFGIATAKQQIEALAIGGEDCISASGGAIGRGPVASPQIARQLQRSLGSARQELSPRRSNPRIDAPKSRIVKWREIAPRSSQSQ